MTVRKAVRRFAVVAGIAITALAGSVSVGSAAVDTTLRVAKVEPAPGAVVGVAHPVVVSFDAPVTDRRAAERSIVFDSPRTPSGDFVWRSNSVVSWEPEGFWPAHSTISLSVGGAPASFETSAAVVAVADISAHTFTVSMDDEVLREMPASMGKPGFATPTGSFTALEKQRNVTFDSRTIGIPLDDPEGYLIKGEYGVRVTWGGVYVHSAPWSVGSQGNSNVSHGCINLSPDNAAWYFDMVRIGDPIIVQA
ncbi:L,D-transpeptidase [Mycobacterium sp. NPDC050041]|uniref:L,D-transpeptidase n=1 Tax=Mycobacterium sp. NPDC050041 TaxID=3364293 RepID=UPI003C2D132D